MTISALVIKEVLTKAWGLKFEILSLLLSIGIVCLVGYADKLQADIEGQQIAHEKYKLSQLIEDERTQAAHKARLELAEEVYNERIKALERSNSELTNARDRMSVALTEARRKFSSASDQARVEYLNALDTVSGQCIARYSEVAKLADGHATDAYRMSIAWPIEKPP